MKKSYNSNFIGPIFIAMLPFLLLSCSATPGGMSKIKSEKGLTPYKPTIFHDFEGEIVTEEEFYAKNQHTFYTYFTENDSVRLRYKIKKFNKRKLTPIEKNEIMTLLEKTVHNTEIDRTKTAVIHYYSKDCYDYIKEELTYPYYFQTLKGFPNLNAYFITQKGKRYKSRSKFANTFEDIEGFIPRVFLEMEVDCVNYIIIQPDGTCKVIYGKTDPIGVLNSAG